MSDSAQLPAARVPRIPLNVRLRRHRGRHLAIGYEHALELSETAVFIWQRVDGRTDVATLAEAVSAEYGIGADEAAADVLELLQELAGHQLLVWEDQDGGAPA
ncbi:PqqD family protein [Streptomyces sp. NPDC091267]|uniref:PqqD family protein n=1 Tax=unclassified Streptomyces TaxID=2593676 RepID=UPI00342C0E51